VQISVETQKDGSFLTSLHIAFLSVLIALPIFSGFDIFSASRFGIFLLINVICGQYIWSRLVQERKPEVFESLAAGLAIGTSLPALINIGVRLLDLRGFHTAYIFPTLCILFWIFFDRQRPTLSITPVTEDGRDFRFIIATPFLAIVAWNPQAWPFCATFIICMTILSNKHMIRKLSSRKVHQTHTLTGSIIIATISSNLFQRTFHLEAIWRNSIGTDIAWDEAASWSVAKYGILENVMQYGSKMRNHVLIQAWAGDITETLHLPKFFLTSVTGFGIGVAGIALASYTISFLIFKSRPAAVLSPILLVVQSSMPEDFMFIPSPRVSNSIGLFYFVFSLYLLTKTFKSKHTLYRVCLVVSIGFATYSKFHFGLMLVLLVLFSAIRGNIRDRCLKVSTFEISSVLTFLSTYLLLIHGRDSSNITDLSLSLSFGALLVSFLIMRIHLYLVRSSSQKSLITSISWFSVVFSTVFVWLTNGENLSTYFLTTTLILVSIYSTPVFIDIFKSFSVQSNFRTTMIFGGVLFGITSTIVYLFLQFKSARLSSIGLLEILINDVPFTIQPIAAFLVILLALVWFRKYTDMQISSIKIKSFFLVACLFLAGTNFGNWIVYPFKSDISELFHDVSDHSDQLNSNDQSSIADWLELNTPENSIVGSNFLCSNLILSIKTLSDRLDCRNRNTFAWISALAHRQVLLEVWFPLENYVDANTSRKKYLYLSDTFATQNYLKSYKDLVQLGVDYFIIDRSRTEKKTWSPFASIVFQTEDYFILEL
jgi:hypothetical protein